MKKFILSAVVTIVFGYGCLWAQTSAMKITSDEITLSKTISLTGDATKITVPWSLNILLPKGTLSISSIMEQPFVGGRIIVNSNDNPDASNSAGNIPIGTIESVQIAPSISNFMDLGNKDKYFRNSYITQPYNKSAAQQMSDIRYKENIQDFGGALQIIQHLRPVSFDFKQTEPNEDTVTLKNKVGFIAQEMINVLPHLVGRLPGADIYTVDYTSVIPYLVKAFQEAQNEKTELQEQVSELQDQLASLQELVQSLLAQNENVNAAPRNNAPQNNPQNAIQEAKLFQNLPNPFSEKTVIRYELPKTAGNAYLQVCDVNGRMLQNIQLPHQEIGQVEISAGELMPGTYTYSLVVSGKVIDSKRMVVTQ